MRGVELVFAVGVVVVLQKQLDGVLGGAVMLHHAVHEQRLGRGDVLDLGDEIILLHLAEQDVFALIVAALGEQLIAYLGGRAAEGHLVELRHVVAQAQPHAGVLRDKELHRVHDALGAFVKAVGARVAAAHRGERTAAVGGLPREEAEEKEEKKYTLGQKIGNFFYQNKWWLGFAEKHPGASKWIREGGLFVIVSNLITVLKYFMLLFLPLAFAGLPKVDFGFPGIDITLFGETFKWNIIGYERCKNVTFIILVILFNIILQSCRKKLVSNVRWIGNYRIIFHV